MIVCRLPPAALASSNYTFVEVPTFDDAKPKKNNCFVQLGDDFDDFVIACHAGNAVKGTVQYQSKKIPANFS